VAQAAVGYLFAEEVTAAIDRYSREVADAVVEKAQKLCTLYSKVLSQAAGGHTGFSSAIAADRPADRFHTLILRGGFAAGRG
jgi:hypothetical protein